jgi:copper oxidase (laccase) domain-containing protein
MLVANEASGDVVAIHAGWRGVVAGVVRSAVEWLGSGPLIVAVGPCIGACCFQVGTDVAEAIRRASSGTDVVVRQTGDKAFVDLRAAVRAQLQDLCGDGVRVENVEGCTMHEPLRFHSYRRDGPRSGRMLAAIAAR